jgi:DNA-binding NarL/FixJ family response regulator
VTTTILLADDHSLFRQGLAALLREQEDWQVVAEASSGEDAVRLASEWKPRLAVIDVEMPGIGGIEAAQRIRDVSPRTRIVALSMYADAYYQDRMRDAGASAYVLKNEAIEQLVAAVKAVLRGEEPFPRPKERQGPVVEKRSARIDKDELSAREREVLRLLAEGRRTVEIADLLGISPKTVETYRSRLMNKLDIDSLSGLIKFAIRAGLVSPDS